MGVDCNGRRERVSAEEANVKRSPSMNRTFMTSAATILLLTSSAFAAGPNDGPKYPTATSNEVRNTGIARRAGQRIVHRTYRSPAVTAHVSGRLAHRG